MSDIVDSFYTPGLTLLNENLAGILAAANLLQITSIVSQCRQFMKEELSEKTCFPFLKLAEKYDFDDIREQANKCVLPNFLKLRHSSDFKELSKDALVHYISQDELNTGFDESQAFYTVKEWLEHDPERMQYAEEVLSHVRFMTIKLDKLTDIANTELVDDRKQCRALVRNAFTYQGKIFEKPLCRELQNKPRGKDGFLIIRNEHSMWDRWENNGDTECIIHSGHPTTNPIKSKLDVTFVHSSMSAIQLNNFLFLFATDNHTFQPIMLRYDATTAEWLKLAPVPRQATVGSTAALLEGEVYLMSGMFVSKSSQFVLKPEDMSGKAFQYKMASNEWVTLANVPKPAFASASSASQEHRCVYISGGCPRYEAVSSFYAYDTEADLWLSKPDMNHPRAEHLMEANGGKIYVFGGRLNCSSKGRYVEQIEMYDIISEQWTILKGPLLSICRSFSLICDRNIFVFGGASANQSKYLLSTEIIKKFEIDSQKVVPHCKKLPCTVSEHICGMFTLPQLL